MIPSWAAEQLASLTVCFYPPTKNKTVYLVLIWVYLTDEQVPRLEELMSCPAVPRKCTCKCHLGPIRVLLWIVFNPKIPQTNAYSLQVGVLSLLVFSRNLLGSYLFLRTTRNMVAGLLFFWLSLCRTTPTGVKFGLMKLQLPIFNVSCTGLTNAVAILSHHTSTAQPGLRGLTHHIHSI